MPSCRLLVQIRSGRVYKDNNSTTEQHQAMNMWRRWLKAMQKQTIKLVNRKLDCVWTIEYEPVTEDSCNLIHYTRDDKDGYENELKYKPARLVEDSDRNVLGIELVNGRNYPKTTIKVIKVLNQKHVFDYK